MAEHRGAGYGRAIMLAAEDYARERSIDEVRLNVFGGNSIARSLYRSLGFLESTVQMAKRLD